MQQNVFPPVNSVLSVEIKLLTGPVTESNSATALSKSNAAALGRTPNLLVGHRQRQRLP